MPTFVYLGKYTAKGIAGAMNDTFAARNAEMEKVFAALGGRLLTYGFCMGQYDFIIVAEVPNRKAALIPPIIAGAAGTVSVVSIELMTPSEMDEMTALAQAVGFRVAGEARG
jgi:uncharacterized protein with GYD domain